MQIAPNPSAAPPVTRRSDACRREPSSAPEADAGSALNPADLPALALEKIIHGMAPQALVRLGLASSATVAAVCAVNASAQQILLQALSLRACRPPATALRWVTGCTGLHGLTFLELTTQRAQAPGFSHGVSPSI